jgi:hypothetical protein
LPGDYNADGAVDAADYVVWRTNDGPLEDYNTWRANFGRTAASASATSAAAPEPAATLIVVGLSAILLMRQRARINS